MAFNASALAAAMQALTGDVEIKEAIFYRLLNTPELEGNFKFVPNIKHGLITPVLKLDASIKPYSSTFSGGSDEDWLAKTFEIFENKIEHVTEPQKYIKHWKSIGWVATNGNPVGGYEALAQRLIDQLVAVNSNKIRREVIWSGVRNGAGTTPGATINGFAKIIADAITSPNLPSGQVETSIGAVTSSNILDAVEAVLALVDEEVLESQEIQVLVSKKLFDWAVKKYKALNDTRNPEMILDANKKPLGMYLDAPYSHIPLKIEPSMKTSNRIVATYRENLQFGTNTEDFKGYIFDVQKDNWKINLLGYMELGCSIYELGEGAIAVNDQV